VKDLGADIIIGIDLQEGLLDEKDLNSATKVLEQIITYNISDNTKEQSKLVDLEIKPALKGYSVTSFDDKDSIILAGKAAAEKMLPELKKIAALQGFPEIQKPEISKDNHILITELEINGLESYSRTYIKSKIGIKTPQLASYEQIRAGIKALYSSGNFNKVFYRIKNNNAGHKTLALYLRENPSRKSLKFGLHYDDLYKTGLLLNFTAKRFLVDNSIFSADIILGDFPRYELNYYVDNGYYPSFGLNASFSQFNSDVRMKNLNPDYGNAVYSYNFNEFINLAYVQSTLVEKYAIGGGLEHQYIDIETNNLPASDPYQKFENSYFLNIYGFIKADSRDNPNFPKRGLKFDGKFKYFLSSNSEDFNETSLVSANVEWNQPLSNWLTIRSFGAFGAFLSNSPPDSQKFLLGGYVEQNFLNYSKFYGLPFMAAVGDNKLIVGATLQSRFLRNHYVSAFVNAGNVVSNFDQLNLFNYKYVGYGVGYGYDSPLGPVSGYWAYSPNTKKGLFNVSLGFWF
jgi:NTE family protein